MKRKKDKNKKDGMTLDELKKMTGAKNIEIIEKKKHQDRLAKLLSGEEKAPNEFVEYFVTEAISTMANIKAVGQRIETLTAELEMLKGQANALSGAYNKYIHDISQWMDKSSKK